MENAELLFVKLFHSLLSLPCIVGCTKIMHFFENQSYYLIQAVFLYDKSISVFRIKFGWRFPRREHFCKDHFFILVYLLNIATIPFKKNATIKGSIIEGRGTL